MGNPTTYRGKALTFTRCHLVSSFDGTAFVYDGDGNRVKKTPQSGTATEYFYADGTLYKEKFGVDTILYYRDEDGKICSIMYDSAPYILRKNAQGDVIALCDSKGEVVARYVYDAWGNHKVLNPDGTENTLAGFIGNINPIRYRGYYYDKDLGLYWLKTRFYDPQTGRFISPDSVEYLDPETLGGINLYAYCNNNPVMCVDPEGTMPNWLKWVIGGVVLIGLGIATIATGGAAAGVAGFVVAGAFKGAAIGAISGALVSGVVGGIVSANNGAGFWDGFNDGAANGFMSGAIVGGITGAAGNALKINQAVKFWDKGNFESGFRSMQYHYEKHVLNEGFKAGNNIVKYTKDAAGFASRNADSLKYVVPHNTALQPHWTFIGKAGMNGHFTSMGKILTFWYDTL